MKKGFIKGFLLKFILPVVIIIILFTTNIFLGFLGIIALLGYFFIKNRSRFYAIQASSHYSRGNFSKSIDLFKKSIAIGKAPPTTIISYGYLLLKTGNLIEAEKVLNDVIDSNITQDDKMMAKSNLALVLWKKNQLDAAVELLEGVIENYKTSTIYGSLGFLIILKGDLNKALSFNLEAYEYNNKNAIILDNLAHTYYLLGDYTKSLEIFEKLMALNPAPSFAEAYYDYGLLLKILDKKEEALAKFEKAKTFKLTYLSAVTSEEIDKEIGEIGNNFSK